MRNFEVSLYGVGGYPIEKEEKEFVVYIPDDHLGMDLINEWVAAKQNLTNAIEELEKLKEGIKNKELQVEKFKLCLSDVEQKMFNIVNPGK